MTVFERDFLKQNSWFWGWFAAFLLIGGFLITDIEKGDLVFYFSARRTNFLDQLFKYGTLLGEFIGYIAVFLILLAYRLRYALGTMLLGIGAMVLSKVLKGIWKSPRPLAYFSELGRQGELTFVEGVEVHEWFSFPSGHTIGAFALFSYLAFLLPRKSWKGTLCFALALLVGVSRIYLVQHFAVDVYFGAVFGVGLGVFIFGVATKFQPGRTWLNEPILHVFKKKEKKQV